MSERIGRSTIILNNKPAITGYGSVVGSEEYNGPIGNEFDHFDNDCRFGEDTFEKAESRMQKIAMQTALKRANISENDVDTVFAGDLLNQCIGSTFCMRNTGIPFVGLYGACSTFTLGLALSSLLVDNKVLRKTMTITSSHFCSAERQYRFPLEYGCVRPQTSQRTVTAAGATVIEIADKKPYIDSVCLGVVEDMGVKDANNMGAAMAPVSVKLRPYPVRK